MNFVSLQFFIFFRIFVALNKDKLDEKTMGKTGTE
jgi:hypothetical protein